VASPPLCGVVILIVFNRDISEVLKFCVAAEQLPPCPTNFDEISAALQAARD
jgi:hypothetical protein